MLRFLKHEIKNNWKSFLFTYGLIVAAFFILMIFILCVKNADEPSVFVAILYSNIVIIIAGSMVVSLVLFIINIIRSMYNSIFTDEGYLTLSFPESPDALLISKILSNIIWALLYLLSVGIGISFLFLVSGNIAGDLFEGILGLISYVDGALLTIPFTILESCVGLILSFVILMFSFTLINIGIVRKAKVFLGIIVYFVIMYALATLQMLTGFLSFGLAIDINGDLIFAYGSPLTETFYQNGAMTYVFDITTFIINIGLIIGLYILTRYLFKKHLELE